MIKVNFKSLAFFKKRFLAVVVLSKDWATVVPRRAKVIRFLFFKHKTIIYF